MSFFGRFHRAKRRLKQEWKGLKYIFSSEEGKQVIKVSYVVYETTRVLYNPWRLIDILFFRKLLTN